MDIWGSIFARVSVISALMTLLVEQACSIQCFDCSTLIDERCGQTWELSEEEGRNFLVDCDGPGQTCVKYISDYQGPNIQVVYRYCKNQTTLENYTPTQCEEDEIRGSTFCRCTTDACNGQGRTETCLLSLISVSLFAFIF